MVRFPHLWLRHSALFRCNFASDKNEKNSMEQKTALPENLCADEAVCFIAFIYGETSIPLEANEVEILKGLSGTADSLDK